MFLARYGNEDILILLNYIKFLFTNFIANVNNSAFQIVYWIFKFMFSNNSILYPIKLISVQ
uniref:Uncharacterized protein n=1 Tax=Meloidogyne enterolobii TaxID=390850 RepID=A0A6V7UVK1_MELEN|nr:unnamed protein product [Meloidogyne enterolobii]